MALTFSQYPFQFLEHVASDETNGDCGLVNTTKLDNQGLTDQRECQPVRHNCLRIFYVENGLGAHFLDHLLTLGISLHEEDFLLTKTQGVGQADVHTYRVQAMGHAVIAQVALMSVIFFLIKLDDVIRAFFNALTGASTFFPVDKNDTSLLVLGDGTRLTRLGTGGFFAMLAHGHPVVFPESRISTFQFAFNSNITRYIPWHIVFMIDYIMVISTGYDAGLASDAAIKIHHYAELFHFTPLLLVYLDPGRDVSLATAHILFIQIGTGISNKLIVAHPTAT